MDSERLIITNLVRTIEQLKSLQMDDPVDLLMLAAGQEGLDVRFDNLEMYETMQTFIYSVEVGKLFRSQSVIGNGPTKKDAKRNSAQEAILELTQRLNDLSASSPVNFRSSSYRDHSCSSVGDNDSDDDVELLASSPSPSTSTRSHSRQNTNSQRELKSRWLDSLDYNKETPVLVGLRSFKRNTSPHDFPSSPTSSNPIGELKELADTYQWKQPEYFEVDEYGEDHRKTFVFQCLFRNMKAEGIAANKKTAKKKAAEEMLSMIHGQNGTSSNARTLLSQNHQPSTLNPRTKEVNRKDYIKKLKKIENELKVSSRFYDLDDGYHGNCLCFVRICTDPVTVCHGSGVTKELAHNDAARNAFQILQKW